MSKIKAWITWPDGSHSGWYHCNLLLENGWPIYGHVCSHPCYAPGDLWERREERKNLWKQKGLELEIVDAIPYSQVPEYVMNANKSESYAEWAEANFPEYTKEPEQPKVEVTFVNEAGETHVRTTP